MIRHRTYSLSGSFHPLMKIAPDPFSCDDAISGQMRIAILAVIALLTVPAASMAQDRRTNSSGHTAAPRDTAPRWTIPPRSGPASEGWPRDPVPTWSITPRHGRPTQGIPLPPIGLQTRGHRNNSPRFYGGGFYVPFYAWPVYGVPAVAETYVQSAPFPEQVVPEPPVSGGRLVLDVQPGTAQVFADGYYVGASSDLTAPTGGLVLETGPHKIDLVMPDHEPVTFNVRIASNQFLTYRQVLKPIAAQPFAAAPSARSAPATFYLIPGCYMGNVPPKDANLRPGCDPARAITFQQ
jgi:hypothetical protein